MFPYTRLSNIDQHDDDVSGHDDDDDDDDDDGDNFDDDDDLVPPWGLFPLADFAFWSTTPVSPFDIMMTRTDVAMRRMMRKFDQYMFFSSLSTPVKGRRRHPRSPPDHH